MSKRVVITGLGVISSIGIGWQEFWKNLIEGRSGISPVTSFDTSNQFTHNGGEVKQFKPEEFIPESMLGLLNRDTQLALAATKLALNDALLTDIDKELCVGVCAGTTQGSIQATEEILDLILAGRDEKIKESLICQVPPHSTPSAISKSIHSRGPVNMFSTACAAGNYAIGYGFDMIRLTRADVIVACASDPFSRKGFTGFNQFKAIAPEKCQPFDKNRKGMMVAEGAGVVVLETLESALNRKANIYAEILGYGLSCDAFHMTNSTVEGISKCMKKAMKEAGITKDEVDYISAHGTGTLINDRNECAAIKEVFGERYRQIPVSSIKSMIGHAMGAASAIEAITCALVVKNDIIPPTVNYETPDPECDVDCVPNAARLHEVNIALNNSYAFGGNNACVVFRKYIQ